MSGFAGLSVALSGMRAQAKAMELVGQNIANANTAGYTRQRVELAAAAGVTGPQVYTRGSSVGSGVLVGSVARLDDSFATARVLAEHSTAGSLAQSSTVWSRIEATLHEPGDNGLTAQLSDFSSSWQDLANNPTSDTARTVVLQNGARVASTLNSTASDLSGIWQDLRSSLPVTLTDINTTATSVARLNQAIAQATAAGDHPNELLDQRDQAALHLAELTGATARLQPDGDLDIFLGGSALVRGADAEQLQVAGAGRLSDAGANPVRLVWEGGLPAEIPGGSVSASLGALNADLPGVAADLDSFAAAVATTVNAVHAGGKGADGVSGRDFFTGSTAATLAVALTSTGQVAAASTTGGALDNTVADSLGALAGSSSGPDARWRTFVTEIGSRSNDVSSRADLAAQTKTEADAARESAAGVSIDEEMTNLLAFQRAYQGAARVMTAVDEVLDQLINRTGSVGR